MIYRCLYTDIRPLLVESIAFFSLFLSSFFSLVLHLNRHKHTHTHKTVVVVVVAVTHQQNRSASMIDMYIDNSEPSENVGQIHFCVEYDFQNTTLILKILQVIILRATSLYSSYMVM